MSNTSDRNNGLLILFTGNGKGKTTSALGQAFRAIGHGFKVCMIQFIKGNWKYGELDTAKQFAGLMDVHVMGRGFTWASEDMDKDIAAAREGWDLAKQIISEGKHRLVILDELTYLITYKMIDEQDVLDTLKARPGNMHVVVTGRGASEKLIQAADLVTEMVDVKHPYENGVKAQKGIEF
ncbi:MAG: cob(I)yrinic acid a,c-diamide adenosyltransferase [Desulfobulbaceae bacterium]|nr:cob(I)yrinic acid a,c-diamide adenosyltransferase [Desulfobulbaceae bacterium]